MGVINEPDRMTITLSRSSILRLAIVSTLMLVATTVFGQPAKVQVIPQPKQLAAIPDIFHLSRDTRIALADPKSEEDRFAAQDFIDDVKATAGLSLAIGKAKSRRTILVGRLDLAEIAQALKRSGTEAPATLNDEGYILLAAADQVIVAGKTLAGTFYGLQTLKQLVRGAARMHSFRG